MSLPETGRRAMVKRTSKTVWTRASLPLVFAASGLAWWAIIDLARFALG
jgi:hypothetical protein